MSPQRVLLVEDDADIRAVATLALGALGGFQVRAVGNGRDALPACHREPPDLLVLDYMMPGMNGLETLATLREAGVSAPAIFMTASLEVSVDASALRGHGVIGVITKPFDAIELAAEIRRLWEQSTSQL